MQAHTAKVIKIKSPSQYVLKDCHTNEIILLQIVAQGIKTKQLQLSNFYPLLKQLSDEEVVYQTKNTKQFRDQYRKGSILCRGDNILKKYTTSSSIQPTFEVLKYVDEILECFVCKVEGLKLLLYVIDTAIFVSFYFSQLKLPKPREMHSKTIWERSQEYMQQTLEGQFVQVKVNGWEKYREEVNIYGDILRRHDGEDFKEKIVADGYAQLSKNGQKYLTKQKVTLYQKLSKNAIDNKLGLYQIQKKSKAVTQTQQLKYRQWEQWSKDNLKLKDLKNDEEELKCIMDEYKRQTNNKVDPHKVRQLIQVIMTLLPDQINLKTLYYFEQYTKMTINAFSNCYLTLNNNLQNTDLIKTINKMLNLLIFYLVQIQKIQTKKSLSPQFQKVIRYTFKLCYIGNQTFHDKIFGKNKQTDFENFSFDSVYLNGGISSVSQQSDYDDNEKTKEVNKSDKKLISMYTRIRTNSTMLISLIFKNYPTIVQNNWDICVKSNTLTQQFFTYLKKMSLNEDQIKMTSNQKKQIVNLMRTNFGQNSLILLVVFQLNAKVKFNALSAIIHMINNFQGKKMIDTTDKVYIEKLLKDTKSSYVPKSFIIFSGLRNALYFMLFSLHYEKSIQVIMQTFKALSQLCLHSSLMDKMGFEEGMGLLMQNYIFPVLQFSWELSQLRELKILCISFLGVLVSTQKKWNQIQSAYLLCQGQSNINRKLLQLMEINIGQVNIQQNKIVVEITKYFMKLAKRYYSSLFCLIFNEHSVWTYLCEVYLKNKSINFIKFVEEVFKCHFDHMHLMSQEGYNYQIDNKSVSISQQQIGKMMNNLVLAYSQIKSPQIYSSLLNTFTNMNYDVWEKKQYQIPLKFIQFCFNSLRKDKVVEEESIFKGILAEMKNSYVRIGLIKLVGYMSFCPIFQNKKYILAAFKILLDFGRTYKSPNSIIKITWGLSNWSNLPNFSQQLQKKQLEECLEYLINHSKSDKQKIASNSTRGIGFFIKNVGKQMNLQKCREAIIANLSHPIIKVRTNSTKTLTTMVHSITNKQIQDLLPILQTNLLKNNYHLQTQTLHILQLLGNPIPKKKLLIRYSQILNTLNSHTTMEYQFSQIKAIKHLRRAILQQILPMSQELSSNPTISKQIVTSIYAFISDLKQQSIRKQSADENILEMGFEKGRQAQNTIFNIQNSKQYDEQKLISTQITTKSIKFLANQKDLQLMKNIQNLSTLMKNISQEWQALSMMIIEGNLISMGDIKI